MKKCEEMGTVLFSEKKSKKLILLGLIGIILLGAVLYSNILHAPFVFDDHSSIKENDSIRSIAESFKKISSNRYLTSLSFAVNYAAGGLNPFSYHLINNSIHILNALLVYYLVVLTFKTPYFSDKTPYFSEIIQTFEKSPHPPFSKGGRGGINLVAFASAFIFIAHPIQTQAVTYIAQRAASMAAMFYLLSLVIYIKWRLSAEQQTSRAAEQQSRSKTTTALLLYCASLISAILAMKSKETAFTLPVVIVLYEFSFFNKTSASQYATSNLRRFLYLLPILFTLLIIPLSMLNFTAPVETITQDINIQSRETVNITRTDYLLTQFRIIVTYLRLLVLPITQNFDYDYPIYNSFFEPNVFLSFLLLLSIFGIGVYLFHRSRLTVHSSQALNSELLTPNFRLIAFGIFWFFITLSVESSIIPIRDVIVEHRLYLPSIGFFIAAVLSVDYLFSNMRLKTALMAVIVLALSVGAYNRNTVWKDPQTLWEDVIAKAPNNARAYNNLGVELKNKGEFDKAIEQFEKSLKADKNYTSVFFNLGDVQYRLGNYEDAVVYLKKALTLKLNQQLHLDVLNKLGRTYSAMGQAENAIDAFKEAIKVYPTAVAPYNNLGVQYIKTGRFDLAIETLEKALKIREEPYKGRKDRGIYKP
ncbi:MAG: tetratricopeptide repeat protein [Nitrospirae bacterium]|nr:tetratricopeptide repeat protein [Nitrospirota bacterium]